MLNVLCCRVEGSTSNMTQGKSRWQFWGGSEWSDVKFWRKTFVANNTNEIWSWFLNSCSEPCGVFGRLRRLQASSGVFGVFGVFGPLRRLRHLWRLRRKIGAPLLPSMYIYRIYRDTFRTSHPGGPPLPPHGPFNALQRPSGSGASGSDSRSEALALS